MARSVFFSFHYQRDIFRVQQIKNHHITKGSYTQAGYFDGSLEERAKSSGVGVVKKLINDGMVGSSVLCLLIGQETSLRHWCYYEVFRAISEGMGVFGIRIHQLTIPTPRSSGLLSLYAPTAIVADIAGTNPFQNMYYQADGLRYQPKIKYNTGWADAPHNDDVSWLSAPPYLKTNTSLDAIFKVYDWNDDNGYLQFGNWVEAAARQAGR